MKHQPINLCTPVRQSLIVDMYCPGHREGRFTPNRFHRCTGCRTKVYRATPSRY